MSDLSKFSNIEGLDVNAGLEFVSQMEDIYLDILETFVAEFGEKMSELETSYAANDFADFAMYVHGMKSSLRYLGANELADAAYELELASKNSDADLLNSTTPGFFENVKQFNNNLKAVM